MAELVRKNVFWPTDVAVPRRRIRALKWVPRTLPLSVPGASPQHSWRGRNKIGRLVPVGPTSPEHLGALILEQDPRRRACLPGPA